MRTIFDDGFFAAALDEERNLILIKRSPAQFPNTGSIQKSFGEMCARLEELATPGRRLLFNIQGGPLRTDESFEAALRPLLARLHQAFGLFLRHAIVVRSAVGQLQVMRHQREHNTGGQTVIFRDEAEARAYLG